MSKRIFVSVFALLTIWQKCPAAQQTRVGANNIVPLRVSSTLVVLDTPTARAELKLTDAQRRQIAQLRRDFYLVAQHRIDEYFKQRRSSTRVPDLTGEMIDQAATTTLGPRMKAILSPAQSLRLQQLLLQSLHHGIWEVSAIADVLGLSKEQNMRIHKINDKWFRELDEAPSVRITGTEAQVAAQLRKFRLDDDTSNKSLERDIEATILTPPQRKDLDALRGRLINTATLSDEYDQSKIVIEFQSPPGITPPASGAFTF